MNISRMKRINMILLLLLFGLLNKNFSMAESISSHHEIELSGKLSLRTFLDANGKAEKEFVLTLLTPISVAKDEFGGPVNEITEIQMVLPSHVKGIKYSGKHVVVKGVLFYPITAHHHTKVLMEVKTIRSTK